MEELRREFEALQQRWEADHRQLVRLEASSGDRTHVVVQRERTIRRFSGSPDQQVADWVEAARACLGVHGLDFVLSNLEGAARIEIKCRPAGEREDVEKLFRALEEVYGETLTSSQLLRQFYERRQAERESMSDLSHALVLLANKMSDGNCEQLANNINDCFVSVSEHLPRLTRDNDVFAVDDELPDRYIISVDTTFEVLSRIQVNKATGPDTIPAWVLKNYAAILAAPLTAIFNCSLREGTLPNEWKMANVIPLPKVNPL